METRELLHRAQVRSGAKSQRELAKILNLNNSSLSLLASGKGELSDETYIRLAKLAGEDPAQILIEKHERKAGPEARAIWAKITQAMQKNAGMMVIGGIVTPALLPHFDKFINGLCLLC